MVEELVYCAEPACGYAGTIDCVATIEDQTVVLDWKRAKNAYPEYRLQVSAYAHGLMATTGLLADKAMIVVLPQQPNDGPVRTFDVMPDELAELFAIFKGLVATWRWRRALDERTSAAMTTARLATNIPPASPYLDLAMA